MNSTMKDLKVKEEFPGSAGKRKKLPGQEKTSKPTEEFAGSAGKGPMAPSNC